MRIAYVTPVLPHPRAGLYRSIERIAREQIREFVSRGHEVEVFTTFWNGGSARDAFLGATVTRVRDSASRLGRVGRVLDADYFTFGRAVTREILARRPRFDVVHSLSRLAGTGSLRKAGFPVVQHFYHKDEMVRILDLVRVPFENAANGISFRAASQVIALAQHGVDVLENVWRVPPARVSIAHPGVALPATTERVDHVGYRILFVGTFTPRKGLRFLIDAVSRLPGDAHLTLVGEGVEQAAIKAQAAQLGTPLEILPPFARDEELDQAYRAADVLVLPSLEEGFGMVLAEAMAREIPVIGSDIPAIREVVGDAGILVPPGDALALASAIRSLQDDPVMAKKLSVEGRARVLHNFTWARHADAVERAWAVALGRDATS